MTIAPQANIVTPTLQEYFNRQHRLKLYQGDCTNTHNFTEEFIDLIITSPPYNVGIEYKSNDDTLNYNEYLDFTEKWIKIVIFGVRIKQDFC